MIYEIPESLLEAVKKVIWPGYIEEMAAPTKEIQDKTFYHGTYGKPYAGITAEHAAQHIAIHGLLPMGGQEPPKKETNLTPMHGHTYATSDIGYAQIYAIGGDLAGTSSYKPKHTHGFVFAFKGKKLSDIKPDEDKVGELYYQHHAGTNKAPSWLLSLINKHTTDYSRKKAKEGEYEHFAKIGKKVIPHMTPEQHLDIITNHSPAIANLGPIQPERVYRINTSKIPHLKRDGSNFFEHAEELDLEKLKHGEQVVRRKRKPL